MMAYLGKDREGFWCAYVTFDDVRRPDGTCVGDVRTRYKLPVAMTATKEQADAAFRRFMSREARKRLGHR